MLSLEQCEKIITSYGEVKMLDADEYVHLAMKISEVGSHHSALEYLYKALEKDPEHIQARYLLAAEHAELGLFDRAAGGIKAVLEAAPGMDIARFQLGLLELQLENAESAREHFSTLTLSESSLSDFSKAYVMLIDNNFQGAAESLKAGLSTCENSALVADMARVLASIEETASPSSDEKTTPVYLGAYHRSGELP